MNQLKIWTKEKGEIDDPSPTDLQLTFHREDGPAVIQYQSNGKKDYVEYWLDGEMHRTNGPAFISFDANENENPNKYEYYINDKKYSFDEWKDKVNAKEVKVSSKKDLAKQAKKDKIEYNGEDYYVSSTGNKPVVYTLKENKIFESFKQRFTESSSKELEKLELEKLELSTQVEKLIDKKKELYSNIDISEPMSKDEKELTKKIADLWAKINQIVKQKRKLM